MEIIQQVGFGNKQVNLPETAQGMERFGVTVDLMAQASLELRQEFEKSAEGVQSAYLADLLTRTISVEHFLAFLSAKEEAGPLGVITALARLEQQSMRKRGFVESMTIASLNSKLKEARQKAQSGEIINWQVWNYYTKLKNSLPDEVKRLQQLTDHNMFVAQFMELISKATNYPQVPIAKVLSSRKTTPPQILALENHSLILNIWRLLMKRFWFAGPKNQAELWGQIQVFNEQHAMELIVRKIVRDRIGDAGHDERGITELRQKATAELNQELSRYFRSKYTLQGIKGIEDPGRSEENSNIFAFEEHLDTRTNTLLRLLSENGQSKEVDVFLSWFGTPGERKKKETRRTFPDLSLRIFNSFVKPITRNFSHVAEEAIHEFSRKLSLSNDIVEKNARKEMQQLRGIIERRMNQLTAQYKANRIMLLEIQKSEELRARKLTLPVYALGDISGDIQAEEQRSDNVLLQITSVLLIADAEYELRKLEYAAARAARIVDKGMLDTGLLEVKSRVHQHLADNKQAFDHVNKAIEYLCWTTLNGRRAERVEYIKKTMAVLEIRKELKGIMESKRRLYDRARQSLNFLGLQSRAAAQESDASMRMLREHGFMPHARHEVN